MTARTLDIAAHDLGSLLTLAPVSDAGARWIDEHLADAAWYGGRVLVEHRCGPEILACTLAHGLYVTLDGREPRENA